MRAAIVLTAGIGKRPISAVMEARWKISFLGLSRRVDQF